MTQTTQREEKAIVLDFLPNGYPFDKTPSHKKTAIAQAIGTTKFTLLELVPKKYVHLMPHQEVYIGEGKREEIHHINGKIPLSKLTGNARMEAEFIVNEIVTNDETRFVDFFNNSQALSMRMHQLELLPGLGKKHMWEIIDERKGDPFKSFQDLKERVKLIPDPKKLVIKRIMKELEGTEKYKLFAD
ncbi:DUF655 domain-containing protein [Candidatus Woesearchaeota archaeon]|nr:MAG: DUF655 domain-containing protein [Candidatus Woesearchaeota archaeon]